MNAALGFNVEDIYATTGGASRLHRLYERGSIASGMRADLLLLNSILLTISRTRLTLMHPGLVASRLVSVLRGVSRDLCDPATFGVRRD